MTSQDVIAHRPMEAGDIVDHDSPATDALIVMTWQARAQAICNGASRRKFSQHEVSEAAALLWEAAIEIRKKQRTVVGDHLKAFNKRWEELGSSVICYEIVALAPDVLEAWHSSENLNTSYFDCEMVPLWLDLHLRGKSGVDKGK